MDWNKVNKDIDYKDTRNAAIYFTYNPHIDEDFFYYGSTKHFNVNKPKQSRPYSSQHPISEYLDKDSILYIIYGLTEEQARVWEAYLIKCADKPLSKKGSCVLEKGYLLNKKRELKYEKLIEKYIYDGNNPLSIIRRKSYCN